MGNAPDPQVSEQVVNLHDAKFGVNVSPGTTSKKRSTSDVIDTPPAKKLKRDGLHGEPGCPSADNALLTPVGSQWRNNSCAYDAITTILFDLWKHTNVSPHLLNSIILTALFQDFALHSAHCMAIDNARDNLRKQLNNLNADKFSLNGYVGVHTILDELLATQDNVTVSFMACSSGEEHIFRHPSVTKCALIPVYRHSDNLTGSLQEYMSKFHDRNAPACQICEGTTRRHHVFVNAPGILAFDLVDEPLELNRTLDVPIFGRSIVKYYLCGIIYFGHHHFTARIVNDDGVWYHDGLAGSDTYREDLITPQDMLVCRGRTASVALYAA